MALIAAYLNSKKPPKTAIRATQTAAPARPGAEVILPASAASAAPVIVIPRSQWGAKEPAVTTDGTGEYGPYSAANPNGWLVYDQPLSEVLDTIIVHHSALPLSDGPLAIQRLHMEEKGFADIGYQYLINETGQLFEGRALNVRGAHTFGANFGSVGICLIGNFEEVQPAEVQLGIYKALAAALIKQYPRINRMAGHKDFNPGITLCPGKNLYPLLPSLAADLGIRYGI